MAAHWVELLDEDGNIYYYNAILGRSQWIEPEFPTKIPLDDEGTLIIAEDEKDRVMPSHADLHSSGRFDLIAAIRFHGGYGQVAFRFCLVSPAWMSLFQQDSSHPWLLLLLLLLGRT